MSRFMTRNESNSDRVLRVLVGVGLLSMYAVGSASPWLLLGIVPLLTGLSGRCPLYSVFGVSTCARDQHA